MLSPACVAAKIDRWASPPFPAAETMRVGDPETVEPQVEGGHPVVADLVDRLAAESVGERASLLLDDERRQAGAAVLAGFGVAGACEELDEVGAAGVAAPALLAVDHPLVAVCCRPALDVRQVGPGVRLGERDGTDPLTAGAALEQLSAPALVADLGAHALGVGDDRGRAHPRPRQLLGDQAVLEHTEAHAADVGRQGDPEVAHLAHAVEERAWDVALLRVQLVGQREHLVHREAAGGVLQRSSLLRQVPAHVLTLLRWSGSGDEVRAPVVDDQLVALGSGLRCAT